MKGIQIGDTNSESIIFKNQFFKYIICIINIFNTSM